MRANTVAAWALVASPLWIACFASACGGTTAAGGGRSGAEYCGPDTVWCGGECVAVPVASQACPGGSASSFAGSSGGASNPGGGSGSFGGSSGGPSGGFSGTSSGGVSGGSGGVSGSSSGGGTGSSSGPSVSALGYDVIDAAYSRAIDQIVLVTATDVHLVDPTTLDDVSITLPTTAESVAVSPDGTHAAVGHNGFISYIDLNAKSVASTWSVSAPIGDVALSNTYVYGFPSSDQWVSLYAVEASTGAVTTSGNIYAGMQAAVSPDGTSLYEVDTELSPSSLYSLSLANPAQPMQSSTYFGDEESPCGELWVSKDGSRLYTGCGYVFNSDGLTYLGEMTEANEVVASEDDWSADGTIAVLGGTVTSSQFGTPTRGAAQLQIYEPEYLTLKTTVSFPSISTPNGASASDGRYVFHDAAGTSTYAILHGNDPTSQVDVYAVAKLQ